MAKNYSKTSIETPNNLIPKDETINFILNYSKALSVIKSEKVKFELVLN